jgi:hypothetical protein
MTAPTWKLYIDTYKLSSKGPLNNQGKPAYLLKKQTQTNQKNMRKINPRARGQPDSPPSHPRAGLHFARGARCRTGKTPPRSRVGRSLRQGSASLRGRAPPRAGFRLAQGLDAPSSEVPSRSRAEHPLEQGSASLEHLTGPLPPYLLPDRGIECTDMRRRTCQRRIHATTRLGITPRPCSANSPGEAIPATVRRCAAWPATTPWHCATHSRTTNAWHPRKRTAVLSKGRQTTTPRSHRTTPLRRAGGTGHLRRHRSWAAIPAIPNTIPGTASPSPILWGDGVTRFLHDGCCAPRDLPSAAPSSLCTGDDQTGDPYNTTLEAALGRIQGTP